MVQIKCLSNGLYSLKKSHIPFGIGFQPPPTAGFRLYLCLYLCICACGDVNKGSGSNDFVHSEVTNVVPNDGFNILCQNVDQSSKFSDPRLPREEQWSCNRRQVGCRQKVHRNRKYSFLGRENRMFRIPLKKLHLQTVSLVASNNLTLARSRLPDN